jgi:hypothetical protein
MPAPNPILSLRRAMRNSPWLVMSILFHAILLVWLGLQFVQGGPKDAVDDNKGIVIAGTRVEEPAPEVPIPEPIIRTIVPPDQKIEVVDPFTPLYTPTDLPPEMVDLSKDIGDPDSTDPFAFEPPSSSTGAGVGSGGVHGFGPSTKFVYNPFGPRGPGGLGPPGRPLTGQPLVIDKAVREGLLWLCRHQNADGSWGSLSMREHCAPGQPCFDPKLTATAHYDEGLTGLALLAFLGAGFTHLSHATLVDASTAKRHDLGDVVKRGLSWLRNRQNADGSFSRERPFLYNEALATMALSEAYGMTQNPYWKDPAQKGVDFLQRAQRLNPSGKGRWGWRYASREDVVDFRKGTGDESYQRELFDSDTSVTAWCVMALKSAELCRLSVERESMEGALAFCDFVTANDGQVGYLDAKGAGAIVTGAFSERFTYHPTTMSALGMCIRIFGEHDPGDPFLPLAAKRIVADLPTITKDRASVDYYYWYYASLALFQLDGPNSPSGAAGKLWNPWYKALVDTLVQLQDHRDRTCSEGGWLESDRWGNYSGAGPLYDTALNVLTLEVTFRYPNAFGAKLPK